MIYLQLGTQKLEGGGAALDHAGSQAVMFGSLLPYSLLQTSFPAQQRLLHPREGTKAVPKQLLLSKRKCFPVSLNPKALWILDALILRGKKKKEMK